MSEHIEEAAAAPEEDLLLPEGWTEDEDLFAGSADDGEDGPEALPPREDAPEEAPAAHLSLEGDRLRIEVED